MRTKSILLSLVILLLVTIGMVPALPAHAAQTGGLEYGSSVNGFLTESNGLADYWQFYGSRGDVISIQMVGLSDPDLSAPDTYLILQYEDGTVLVEDDDSAGGTDSLIANFELPLDGTYIIVATSFGGADGGWYELSLELVGRLARRIDYLGQINYGESRSADLIPEVPAHVWEFEGRAGEEIYIAMYTLEEALDPYLILLQMDEVELEEFFALSDDELGYLEEVAAERGIWLTSNDDWNEEVNSLIPSYVLPADGRYFIVATSCCTGGSSGPYELALDLISEPDSAIPEAPPPEDFPRTVILNNVSPGRGQAGSELTLSLGGEGLSEIGPLWGVEISGVEISVLDFEVISDRILETTVLIPENVPTGEQEISFFFENDFFDANFFVDEPIIQAVEPPVVRNDPDVSITPTSSLPIFPILIGLLLLVGVTGGLGFVGLVVWRLIRPGKPQEIPKGKTTNIPSLQDVRFKPDRDLGIQKIEPANGPIKFDIDIRFSLINEQSTQYIEGDEPSLIV